MKYRRTFYDKYIKRIIDFILSAVAIVILSPVLLIVALVVRVKLGTPVIFKQQRPGMNEKIFTMYKFRTMTDKRNDNGELLPDEERLTKCGKILRATSLDELPELINILLGHMSIVGPRPLAVAYLPYYTDRERHRHDVKPGLTGLAQVKGRNSLSWEEKFEFDLEYIENISLSLDAKIIFKTIEKVIRRKDIGQGEEAPVSLHILRKEK